MKVFVNNIPKEPKECLFSVKGFKADKTQKKWSFVLLYLQYE